MSKSALIFGASGISGWAFVNEILHDYPKKGLWKRVHALTNRSLDPKSSLWPDDDRLSLISGIDLLEGNQEDLETTLNRIEGINEVTHVYYLAYKAQSDQQQEYKDAVNMFSRSTMAMDHLSPSLEFVVLQMGAKIYGCHLLATPPSDYIHVPLAESSPHLRSPYYEQLFYHGQLDFISSYAKDKKWNWCDTRPDIIVGFVPNQNFYSLATSLGVFCSLWKELHGKDAECPYPGSKQAWITKSNDSSSDMIARQTIHLSLNLPSSQKGEGFNVADEQSYRTWETRWPDICSWFGLKGIPPPTDKEPTEVRAWIKEHIDVWHQMESKYRLRTGIVDSEKAVKSMEYFLLTQFDFDRQYDMSKMYRTGFKEERDTKQSWGIVFDRQRKARIIP